MKPLPEACRTNGYGLAVYSVSCTYSGIPCLETRAAIGIRTRVVQLRPGIAALKGFAYYTTALP
jgi:hypothetical protein